MPIQFDNTSPNTGTINLKPGTSGNFTLVLPTSDGSPNQVLQTNGAGVLSFGTPASGVSTISFGSTGLTPSTATSGAVSVSGLLVPSFGGTGIANNNASTIAIIGNFASTFSVSGAYTYTFPGQSDTLAGLATAQTFTNKTLTNQTVTNYVETTYSVTGSSFAVDFANGTVQQFTTNANTTITLPSAVLGKAMIIRVIYGGTHTLTWAGGTLIKFPGGTAPTATSVNGKIDVFSVFQNATATFITAVGLNY